MQPDRPPLLERLGLTKCLDWHRMVLWTVLGAAAMEGITVFMRFGLGLESTRDTAGTIGRLTLGLRIHHGYVGLAVCLVAWLLARRLPPLAQRLLILGLSLVLSDLVHHFVVLWLATGSPEFDLTYPAG
jgi:hypothetical protein